MIQWINVCRGIGIILVVIGHLDFPKPIINYIYAFHMPLFFFLSGYVFSPNKPFINYIKSRFNSLIIPYIYFSIISIALFYFLFDYNLIQMIKEFILSRRNYISYNVSLWFLTTLFITQIVFYGFKKYINNDFVLLFLLFGLWYFIGTAKYFVKQHYLPWTFEAGMYYMIYYCIGNLLRDKKLPKILFGVAVVVNVLSLFVTIYKIFWAFIVCFAGIGTIILISVFMQKSKILGFLGKHSIIVLGLHIPIVHIASYFGVTKNYFLALISLITCSIIAYFLDKLSLISVKNIKQINIKHHLH